MSQAAKVPAGAGEWPEFRLSSCLLVGWIASVYEGYPRTDVSPGLMAWLDRVLKGFRQSQIRLENAAPHQPCHVKHQ